jgi:hypothetical protein
VLAKESRSIGSSCPAWQVMQVYINPSSWEFFGMGGGTKLMQIGPGVASIMLSTDVVPKKHKKPHHGKP